MTPNPLYLIQQLGTVLKLKHKNISYHTRYAPVFKGQHTITFELLISENFIFLILPTAHPRLLRDILMPSLLQDADQGSGRNWRREPGNHQVWTSSSQSSKGERSVKLCTLNSLLFKQFQLILFCIFFAHKYYKIYLRHSG